MSPLTHTCAAPLSLARVSPCLRALTRLADRVIILIRETRPGHHRHDHHRHRAILFHVLRPPRARNQQPSGLDHLARAFRRSEETRPCSRVSARVSGESREYFQPPASNGFSTEGKHVFTTGRLQRCDEGRREERRGRIADGDGDRPAGAFCSRIILPC